MTQVIQPNLISTLFKSLVRMRGNNLTSFHQGTHLKIFIKKKVMIESEKFFGTLRYIKEFLNYIF